MVPSYSWQRLKEAQHPYRRRRPEQSALYRIVSSGREEIPRVWEERFQGTCGVLRDEVLSTFDEYLNCGILAHGAARAYCATCKHTLLVAFSCKKRGLCPSCGAKRAVKFAEHLYDTVLERVPHRHCGFTLPKRLRAYFRYDRKLNGILFRAASIAVQRVLGTGTQTPGLVLTVQTAGEALNFNPHLHGLITNGTFDEAGTFTPVTVIDTERITAHFQDEVLSELIGRGLITDEVPRQLLSQEHTGFGAWVGEPFVEGERTRFVARYIERGPIALDKLTVQDDLIIYTTNDGRAHEYDVAEFLALLSCHIPKPYESMTRYYGYYSCRKRGERRKQQRHEQLTHIEESHEPGRKPSLTWAVCMKRIFEFDPLECPRCKSAMRIISFITKEREVLCIADALGIPRAQAPPKIPRAREPEYFDELSPDEFS